MSNRWWSEQPGSGAFERTNFNGEKNRAKFNADPSNFHEGCGGVLVRWDPEIKQPRGHMICHKCKAIVNAGG